MSQWIILNPELIQFETIKARLSVCLVGSRKSHISRLLCVNIPNNFLAKSSVCWPVPQAAPQQNLTQLGKIGSSPQFGLNYYPDTCIFVMWKLYLWWWDQVSRQCPGSVQSVRI